MTALVMVSLLSAPPGERQLETAIEEAQRQPAMTDRIEQISRLFLGTPYGQYPLGEGSGVEPQPRWRADLVVRGARGLVVRHASFGEEKKVIEEGLGAFLDRLATYRSWPVIGVALLRAVDARSRANAATKSVQ